MSNSVVEVDVPPAKFFGRGDALYVQAQQIWLILVGLIMARRHVSFDRRLQMRLPELIYYSELCELMGKPGAQRTLDRQLGITGRYCVLNDLPPINAVVVNKTTEMPGHDVVVRPGRMVEEEMAAAGSYNWYSVRVPTIGAFRKVYDQRELIDQMNGLAQN